MKKRTTFNFIVDAFALAVLLCLTATGSILKFILPPGSGGGQGHGYRGGRGAAEAKSLFNLYRHDWGDIHFILALIFIVLILVHILMHWKWITNTTTSILFPSHRARPSTDGEG